MVEEAFIKELSVSVPEYIRDSDIAYSIGELNDMGYIEEDWVQSLGG